VTLVLLVSLLLLKSLLLPVSLMLLLRIMLQLPRLLLVAGAGAGIPTDAFILTAVDVPEVPAVATVSALAPLLCFWHHCYC
jgi:hypothetical protein